MTGWSVWLGTYCLHEDNQKISAGHLGTYVDIYWGLAFDDSST